jgi:hypothetical protein
VGCPGGPIDVSLLTRYEQHVSRYIWLWSGNQLFVLLLFIKLYR